MQSIQKRISEGKSFQLPSIINLDSKCKTIFQKCDHIEQILMEIIADHFYPNTSLTKQSHYPKFYEILKDMHGEEDGFTKFIESIIYFMRVIRELRNGLDHRLPTYKINNFEISLEGFILMPTIELNHKHVKMERTDLSDFLKVTLEKLVVIIESTFAFLAQKAVRKSGMQYQLKQIPEEKRQNKFVKYSFWIPVGENGFYCQ